MDVVKNKIVLVFNKFYYDFVNDVSTASSSLKSMFKVKVKDLHTTKYSKVVFESLDSKAVDVITETETVSDLFTSDVTKGVKVQKDVTLGSVIESVKSNHETIASYLYIFSLMKVLFDITTDLESGNTDNSDSDDSDDIMESVNTASILFDKTMECIKMIQKKEPYGEACNDIMDSQIKKLLERLNTVMSDSQVKTEVEDIDDATNHLQPDMLQGTKIGSLAQEISKEIDLKELNIEKPEDILNLTSNNMLGNIINKVGSKMQEKIDKGELKHEDLIKEAFGMFSNMNGKSSMFNNPMMQAMMKNMGGMGGTKGGKVQVNEAKLNQMSQREKLRQKLEARKAQNNV